MKSVYELTNKELKENSRAFNKTAYGRRMLNLRNGSIFVSFLAVLVYGIIFSVNESAGLDKLLQEGFSWLIIISGTILEFMCHAKYNQALKEFVEYKNKDK